MLFFFHKCVLTQVPLDETTATDDDLQPPVLERSAPPSDDSVPSLNDSVSCCYSILFCYNCFL